MFPFRRGLKTKPKRPRRFGQLRYSHRRPPFLNCLRIHELFGTEAAKFVRKLARARNLCRRGGGLRQARPGKLLRSKSRLRNSAGTSRPSNTKSQHVRIRRLYRNLAAFKEERQVEQQRDWQAKSPPAVLLSLYGRKLQPHWLRNSQQINGGKAGCGKPCSSVQRSEERR